MILHAATALTVVLSPQGRKKTKVEPYDFLIGQTKS